MACVLCTVQAYTVLRDMHKVTWYRRYLEQWIRVNGMLFANQYIVHVMYVYEQGLPTIYSIAFSTGFY